MTDIELVFKVKNEKCNQSLCSLIEKHSPLCNDIFGKYAESLMQSGVYLNDVYGEKDNLIYKAALTYKPEKKVAFNTWVGNICKYFCKTKISKGAKSKTIPVSSEVLDYYSTEESLTDKQDEMEECDKQRVLDILKENHDKRVVEVFKIRYFSGTRNPVTFKKIGEKMGISDQTVLNIHRKGIKSLKARYE